MNTVPGATRGVTSRRHLPFRALRRAYPNKVAILEAGARRVGGVHLGEHLLLELGEPLVDARRAPPSNSSEAAPGGDEGYCCE